MISSIFIFFHLQLVDVSLDRFCLDCGYLHGTKVTNQIGGIMDNLLNRIFRCKKCANIASERVELLQHFLAR